MRLHSLWRPRASFNSFADTFLINATAHANDHANDLQPMRMIVKNDSHLAMDIAAQETGGAAIERLALCRHDDFIDAFERAVCCL